EHRRLSHGTKTLTDGSIRSGGHRRQCRNQLRGLRGCRSRAEETLAGDFRMRSKDSWRSHWTSHWTRTGPRGGPWISSGVRSRVVVERRLIGGSRAQKAIWCPPSRQARRHKSSATLSLSVNCTDYV